MPLPQGAPPARNAAECTTLVVDASVAIKLFLPEPLRPQALAVFDRLASPDPPTLHVPDLFFVECANILWKYVRRQGYDATDASLNLADLLECPLITADNRLVDRVQAKHPRVAWLGDYPLPSPSQA